MFLQENFVLSWTHHDLNRLWSWKKWVVILDTDPGQFGLTNFCVHSKYQHKEIQAILLKNETGVGQFTPRENDHRSFYRGIYRPCKLLKYIITVKFISYESCVFHFNYIWLARFDQNHQPIWSLEIGSELWTIRLSRSSKPPLSSNLPPWFRGPGIWGSEGNFGYDVIFGAARLKFVWFLVILDKK